MENINLTKNNAVAADPEIDSGSTVSRLSDGLAHLDHSIGSLRVLLETILGEDRDSVTDTTNNHECLATWLRDMPITLHERAEAIDAIVGNLRSVLL